MHIRTLVLMGGVALAATPLATAESSGQTPDGKSKPVTVTGCLTKGQSNSFVLTPITAGDPLASSVEASTHKVVPTYTYQVTGGQNLDTYVGQIVTAKGTEERGKKGEATIDQKRQEAERTSPATPEGKTPTVKTEEKAKIEVRQLTVQSVTSTGKSCSSTSGT